MILQRRKCVIKRRKSKAVAIVKKYSLIYERKVKGSTYDDLYQEGCMTLFRCRAKYKDKNNGVTFEMYLKRALKNTFNGMLHTSNEIYGNEVLPIVIEKEDSQDIEFGFCESMETMVNVQDSIKKSLSAEAKQLLNLIINTPSELIKMGGKILNKDLAQLLRKEEHGQKWSSAKVSQVTKSIRDCILQT